MKKEKLVIIGANDFQYQLIQKAKNRGMETHVFAWEDGSVGKQAADYFYPISITEKELILEKCKEIKPDGILSIASDLAVTTVNYVAQQLNLTGNGTESALLSTNKYLMRKTFEKNGDPSPRYCLSDTLTESMINTFHLPLIVKPIDRSGSRGVTKIADWTNIYHAIKAAQQQSFSGQAIIEEYISGKEYSVEYISWEGQHTFLALTQKYTTGEPHYIETRHTQPANVSAHILRRIQEVIEHALNSLLIKNGASHSEVMVTPDGSIKIVEIGARMGGDCIGSDLVQISTGYDFINMVIDVACGRSPSFHKVCHPQKAEVRFIFNDQDLKQLQIIKAERPECLYRISKIHSIDSNHKITDSSKRLGYYILQGYN